jgi:branched-chain amino acid aminotransferase
VSQPALWVNGRRQSESTPSLFADDRGLTLGDGVFETMRAYRGRVFRLDEHLARLHHGLRVLAIAAPPELREWVVRSVRDAGVDVSVRLTVTRGRGAGTLMPAIETTAATAIVSVTRTASFPARVYETGLSAHVASGRRNERAATAGLKTLAYVDAIVALLEARRAGADEALVLDTESHCSEASASNLFVWTGTLLATPPLSCGALPGITRAATLELARLAGTPTSERPLSLDELLGADEAFLTSSLRGLAPLVRVGRQAIGRGTPGALTRQLAAAYTALVDRECR